MKTKNMQIITVILAAVLVIACAFAVWSIYRNDQNEGDTNGNDNLSKSMTVTLDSNPNTAYDTFTLDSIISESDFIFKGTVIEATQNLGEKEVILKVDDVLKGDLSPQTVILHSNYKPLNFEIGDEFVFFISEGYDGKYKVMTTQGYLKNMKSDADVGSGVDADIDAGAEYAGERFKSTYADLKEKIEKSNLGIVDPVDPVVMDTLEVTYWNPWGGPTVGGGMAIDYVALTLADYISSSAIIVSATVTETAEWNNSTPEGKAKLKELGSPWIYSSNRECYFDVNEILKGNFEIDHIYLKTDMKTPAWNVGDEYVLFIDGSSTGNSDYEICVTEGYLIKNGSNYEGMWQNKSIPYDDLKFLISMPEDELSMYQRMAFSPQVFIGEMLTSTEKDKLVYDGDMRSVQDHQVRVISPIKGNLSGEINFTYTTSYMTNKMMEDYVKRENWTLQRVVNTSGLESDGSGYFRPQHWDPKVSPLKEGDICLIFLWENDGHYYMGASTTDYRIEEHNKKELQKMAEEYQKTLERIEKYITYDY
ncbi:hypothetical protein MmiAt1_15490 [Methanimicrococcus sp. At1]|uniref:Uncharacterized protein n=1 Tax=Methanimicrococcus hacksteinii TaxID=3028293 RepID=A0ABU3VSQ3_9EURY|nr:hypothetical protein [Methanimicrococcus sp. At1]MDV0445945.1 hypothetical protein [Methanimicrococcus sp. At1]